MKTLLLFSMFAASVWAHAEDSLLDAPTSSTDQAAQADAAEDAGMGREPAAAQPAARDVQNRAGKRTYPGAADEEDLQVRARLPEAGVRIDARSVQRDVFKTLYNQELKEDNRESVEE